jgi:hypothetical protein
MKSNNASEAFNHKRGACGSKGESRLFVRLFNNNKMDDISIEVAYYIIKYYSSLLSLPQKAALKHHRHALKIHEMPDNAVRRQLYVKFNWLSDDPDVLRLLDEGYVNFILNCAQQILKDHPKQVHINFCPQCNKLARTPHAKQCRWCGYDWH